MNSYKTLNTMFLGKLGDFRWTCGQKVPESCYRFPNNKETKQDFSHTSINGADRVNVQYKTAFILHANTFFTRWFHFYWDCDNEFNSGVIVEDCTVLSAAVTLSSPAHRQTNSETTGCRWRESHPAVPDRNFVGVREAADSCLVSVSQGKHWGC